MGYAERKRWLFLGLPWTFTKYTIEDTMLTVDTGLLKTVENDCYMYKVQDVKLESSLEKSEEDRRKRRTLNTLDIGVSGDIDAADLD